MPRALKWGFGCAKGIKAGLRVVPKAVKRVRVAAKGTEAGFRGCRASEWASGGAKGIDMGLRVQRVFKQG